MNDITFRNYLKESDNFVEVNKDVAKTVVFRLDARSDGIGFMDSNFFSNGGRTIYEADDAQKEEFGEDVYRIETTGLKHGIVCRIDLKKGTLSFIDNEIYENEGEIVWKKPFKFKKLVIFETEPFGL